jgi:uncharacterized protein YecT (DUF1311 family)
MNQAAFDAFVAADDDLKSALAGYRARFTGDQLRLFDESQKAWEQFRAAACAFQSSGAEGGSVQPLVHAQCMESFTRQRLEQVKSLANCNDEDLSCPASQSDI